MNMAAELEPDTQEQPSLSTTDVAGVLDCSDDQVRRMCESGCFAGDPKAGIPGAWRPGIGGHWKIPAAALELFRARSRVTVVRRR